MLRRIMDLARELDAGPPFSWSGRFRRVDLPVDERAVPGILEINSEEGVTLRLFGTFSDTHPFGSLLEQSRPEWTLVGHVEDGEAVTILGARHRGGREQNPGALELHLRASAVLIGNRQVDDALTCRFDQLEITYDELRAWTVRHRDWPPVGWQNIKSVQRIARHRDPNAADESGETSGAAMEIGYYEHAALRASIRGFGRVTLTLRALIRPVPGGAELAEEGGLLVVPLEPLSLGEVDDEVRVPLDRLLALAFDRKVTRRQLRVRIHEDARPERPGRRRGDDDRWLYVLTGREAARPDPSARTQLLAMQATPENFKSLLTTWIALHKAQRRALNYFFETAFGGERFVDRGLLTAIQAIEGYHRADVPVPVAEKAAFEKDRKRAKELIRENGLPQRVIAGSHGSEPTLDERISDLLNRQVPRPQGTKGQRADRNRFAGRVAELRNGLAHLLERLDNVSFVEMYEYRQHLLALMKLELLRRLGATVEERAAIIENMRWQPPSGLFLR